MVPQNIGMKMHSGASLVQHDQSRLGLDFLHDLVPAVPVHGAHGKQGAEHGKEKQGYDERRAYPFLFGILFCFADEALADDPVGGFVGRGVAVEVVEHAAEAVVDLFEGFAHQVAEAERRLAFHHGGEDHVGALFEPHRGRAHLDGFEVLAVVHLEGVADEILDGGEHRRDHVAVLVVQGVKAFVGDQEPRSAMDQEHLFHAEEEGVPENDFGVGATGGLGLDAPFDAPGGEAALEGLVEGFHGFAHGILDGLSDGGPHHGEERIGHGLYVVFHRPVDRFFDYRVEGFGKLFVLLFRFIHGERQHAGHLLREPVGEGPVILQLVDPLALLGQQDILEFRPLVGRQLLF